MKRLGFYSILSILLFLNYIFGTTENVMVFEITEEALQARRDVDNSQAGLIIGHKNGEDLIVQTVKKDRELDLKLTEMFGNLKNGLSKITCWYDYYDVLAFIDKTITVSYELKRAFTENLKNNEMKYVKLKEEAKLKISEFEKLAKKVLSLCSPNKPGSRDKCKKILYDVTDLKKNIILLKEDDLKYYSKFNVENYQFAGKKRVNELKSLQRELKELRKEISPLCEENTEICPLKENDIKNDPKLFSSLRKIAFEIHDRLSKCEEKETNKLSFLFNFYEDFLKIVGEYITKLEGYKEELEKSNKNFSF